LKTPLTPSPPSTTDARGPVGVFDSGVGGLSVLLEIRRELPHENLLYAADSGNAPYGEKTPEFIEGRAQAIVEFFVAQDAKAVVVACNTATGVAVDALRARWTIPIVGIEPAIKPAVAATRSGVVGVLATTQTIASARFSRLIETFGSGAEIVAQPCPGLVEQIESGELTGAAARAMIEGYVRPLVERGADTLVLGCTHYPFVQPLIQEVAGGDVAILNPAAAVARELRRRLEQAGLASPSATPGTIRYWSSGPPAHLPSVLRAIGIDAADVALLPV
jgi:glutamate racemase